MCQTLTLFFGNSLVTKNLIMWYLWKSESLPSRGLLVFCCCFLKLLWAILVPRFNLRYKLKVFSGHFWACALLLAWVGMFLFSLYMQLLYSVLVFNVWLPKGGKEKWKRRQKGLQPIKSPGNQFSQRRGACSIEQQQWSPSFVSASLRWKQVIGQSTDPQCLENSILFALQAVCKLF